MKKYILATIILVAFSVSANAQISTILTRLTAQRTLTNTNITSKTGAGSITPKNVGYSDDSIMAIMYSLTGLVGAAGGLSSVLALDNSAGLSLIIDTTGVEGEFKTTHFYNGVQTTHDPSGGGGEYPVTFLGRAGGNNVMYLRDAFGYFGYMGTTALTADRKVLLPDEGDGVGLDATLVTHTTEDGLTVSSGSNTGYYDADTMRLADGSGNETILLPYWTSVWNTTGTEKNVMVLDKSALSYAYTNSIGSVSHTATLFFNRPVFTGVTVDSLWFPSATGDTLAVKGDITAMGNFATANLTFTGNRYHNMDRYNVDIDSANMWTIQDTNGRYEFNLNDTANYGTSLFYLSNRSDKIFRVSPNPATGYQSRLYLSNAVAGSNVCQLFSGSNQLTMTQISGTCNVSFNVGAGTPNASLIIDSADKAVKVSHLSGNTSTPTIAAGSGAGTSPTVSVGSGSTDLSGYLNITTGTTCTALATVATITFNVAYASAPKCIIIQPANAITAALTPNAKLVHVPQSTISTTTFEILAGSTALTDATAYKWYYFVVQ